MNKKQYQKPFIKVRLIDANLLQAASPTFEVPITKGIGTTGGGSGRAGDGESPCSKHQGSFFDVDNGGAGSNSSIWSN